MREKCFQNCFSIIYSFSVFILGRLIYRDKTPLVTYYFNPTDTTAAR